MTKEEVSADKKRVKFEVAADPKGQVYVAGTFNGWDPRRDQLKSRNGGRIYSATLLLPAGAHEYRFVVNGKWQADPKNPRSKRNPFGSVNSLIEI